MDRTHGEVVQRLVAHDPRRAQNWVNWHRGMLRDPATLDGLLRPYVAEQEADDLADRIAGQPLDLAGQHAAIDAAARDPAVAAQAKQRLAQKAEAERRAREAEAQAISDRAWAKVLDPEAKSLRAIAPADFARLAPEEQAAVGEAVAANRRGGDPAPNPALYQALADKARQGRLGIADVRRAWGKLPRRDWQAVDAWQRGGWRDAEGPAAHNRVGNLTADRTTVGEEPSTIVDKTDKFTHRNINNDKHLVGPDYLNPVEIEPRSIAELDRWEAALDVENNAYRATHDGRDYADYQRYKDNIADWRQNLEQEQDEIVATAVLPESVKQARKGQKVANGAGLAIGAVNSVAKEVLSDGKVLGKVAGEVLDGPMTGLSAGLKYKELKGLGYSDRAALAGAAAAAAVSQTLTRGGAWAGGAVGTAAGGLGAIPGAVIGGAAGGVLDWLTEASDNAAKKAADLVDGTKP